MAEEHQGRQFFGCAIGGIVVPLSLFLLAACTGQSNNSQPIVPTSSLTGTVYGGRSPITGATVIAYTVATTIGTSPTEIGADTTDGSGRFNITFAPAPTTGQIVYVTVAGGNAAAGTNRVDDDRGRLLRFRHRRL